MTQLFGGLKTSRLPPVMPQSDNRSLCIFQTPNIVRPFALLACFRRVLGNPDARAGTLRKPQARVLHSPDVGCRLPTGEHLMSNHRTLRVDRKGVIP